MSQKTIVNVITDARNLQSVLPKIASLLPRTLDVKAFKAHVEELGDRVAKVQDVEVELTRLRNEREALETQVRDFTYRVRASVKGAFGSDSTEYQLVGGTRTSDRKRPGRRVKAAAAPTP